MKKAEFLPSLYTHNAIIDAQHQELISTINKLYEAIETRRKMPWHFWCSIPCSISAAKKS